MTTESMIVKLVTESIKLGTNELTPDNLIEIAQKIAYLEKSNNNLINYIEKQEKDTVDYTCDHCGSKFIDFSKNWTYCPICGISKGL